MAFSNIPVVIVVAIQKGDRAIGAGNDLLWHLPSDLKRFKTLTLGHPIILGRKTFESIIKILGKPLPGRTNIVVTSNPEYNFPGVKVALSLEDAFVIAAEESPTEIHLGGGTRIYEQSLPYVDRLFITYVDDQKVGDTFFPEFLNDFLVISESPQMEENGITFQWVDYKRKTD